MDRQQPCISGKDLHFIRYRVERYINSSIINFVMTIVFLYLFSRSQKKYVVHYFVCLVEYQDIFAMCSVTNTTHVPR